MDSSGLLLKQRAYTHRTCRLPLVLQVHMDLKSKNVLLNHDKTLAKIADVSDLCTWALPSCCTTFHAQLDTFWQAA